MIQTNTEEEIADEALIDSKEQKVLPHLLSKSTSRLIACSEKGQIREQTSQS